MHSIFQKTTHNFEVLITSVSCDEDFSFRCFEIPLLTESKLY